MYRWLRPLLFRLDSERAHRLAIRSGKLIQRLPGGRRDATPALEQTLFGVSFPNPVGIAAGVDKNAECIPFWQRLGCGFVEVGSVSAEPAPGNPKPRAFRLPRDRALINRMGLNNDGATAVADRIRRTRPVDAVPLGINIVKTNVAGIEGAAAVDDFRRSFVKLAPLADYVVLNVSCPNTDDGKTFEDPSALATLLGSLREVRSDAGPAVPLLVKFSPPESDHVDEVRYRELLSVTESYGVDGYVATNTTASRDGLQTGPDVVQSIGPGGLSGRPLALQSRRLLGFLYREVSGKKPIISVGGIDTVEEAVQRIYLGASLIQMYTGLVYEGPGLIRRLVRGLAARLASDGIANISSAVGRNA